MIYCLIVGACAGVLLGVVVHTLYADNQKPKHIVIDPEQVVCCGKEKLVAIRTYYPPERCPNCGSKLSGASTIRYWGGNMERWGGGNMERWGGDKNEL